MKTTVSVFSFAIILAQCFGMFPITGVLRKDARFIRFKWKSFATFYSAFCFLSTCVNVGFEIAKMVKGKLFGLQDFVTLLFFLSTLATSGMFFNLAFKWRNLMLKWTYIDDIMENLYGFPKNLDRSLKIISVIVMVSAFCEHSLFVASVVKNMKTDANGFVSADVYFYERFDHIFQFVPITMILGIYMQVINVFSTFAWNYMDLFIMLISKMIAARLEQIIKRIDVLKSSKQAAELEQWKNVRKDFVKIKQLSREIELVMSPIILLSFANNLFVVLVQFYNSLKNIGLERHIVDRVYFTYSVSFLILRTAAVAIFGAGVNNQNQELAKSLNHLPREFWNMELDRLLMDVNHDPLYFTGGGVFKVTKQLILHIAGAIVTYEIILIQFHKYE